METVSVSTTQNVDLEYRIAGLGDRILAFGFDYLVMIAWSVIWLIVFTQLGNFEAWQFIFAIPLLFYTLLSEIFMNGQTFGKMVLKTKVAKLDGSELSFGDCLIRWVFRLIEIWPSSGLIAIATIIVTKKSQRLGDIISGCTVVKVTRNSIFDNTNYIEIPNDYVPVYSQSSLLCDEDVSVIKEVLNFVKEKNNTGSEMNYHPMQLKLQTALKQKLGISEVKGSAKQFLLDLLKDFNYLNK